MDKLFIFRNWIVWCYKEHPTRKKYYQRKHDDIFFYTKSDDYIWNWPGYDVGHAMLDKSELEILRDTLTGLLNDA